jgi:hypothetical protein
MTEVGERLKALKEDGQIDLSTLGENEQFIDAVLVATSYALKTSEQEKIKAFQNAILNSAHGQAIDKTKSQVFLNLLDSFTVWHIRILHFIDTYRVV